MSQMIAYCGLDCSQCEAYIATQAGDVAAQEKLLEKWRVEYNAPDMPLSAVTCDGCSSTGRLGGYCGECPVRACSVEKALTNCAWCESYTGCEKLQPFIANVPPAKANLENIRIQLGK